MKAQVGTSLAQGKEALDEASVTLLFSWPLLSVRSVLTTTSLPPSRPTSIFFSCTSLRPYLFDPVPPLSCASLL